MPNPKEAPFESNILNSLSTKVQPSYEGDPEVAALLSPEEIDMKKRQQVEYFLAHNPELKTTAGALELERQSRINAAMRAAANEGIKVPPFVFDPRVRSTRRRKPKSGAS